MAASDTTALQVNYKLADGTLVNVYATDQAHLEALLTSVSDLATLITATSAQLGNSTPTNNMSNVKVQLGAVEVKADKTCKHGDIVPKSGTSAKGPWRAWMCNAPKGALDKCEPIWIR